MNEDELPEEDLHDLTDKERYIKKELGSQREKLETLINSLPEDEPQADSPEYIDYEKVLEEIDFLKGKIASTQEALMNLLRDLNKGDAE